LWNFCHCGIYMETTVFMLKQISCTALAVLFALCIKAQNFGEIHGKVVNERGLPLEMVVVVASNGVDMVTDQTGPDGKYRIKPLKPGVYSVFGNFFASVSDTINSVVVNPDKITFLNDFRVLPNVMIKEVKIAEHRVKLINKDGDHIQTLLAEDLKHRPTTHGGRLSAIVGSMSSDLKPAAEGSGISVRGSREGGLLYFVDGMKIRSSDVVVPASGISSVSLYTGGIPAKYGDSTGGIVIVETKSYLEDFYKKLNQ
jgi:hypothetical protein